MDSLSNLINSLIDPKIILLLVLFVCILLFVIEGYKFFKYKMKSDLMDFSLLGAIGIGSYLIFNDLFLAGLAVIFVLMVIGTYELRESPVWVRLMASFTITYGYLLFGLYLDYFVQFLILKGVISNIVAKNQISGFFWSTMMWILLISAFGFFGKRFLLVSRFLSPQYVYLFVYSAVYIIIFGSGFIPAEFRYLALFLSNAFLYCISGWLLTVLFQIKPLDDERALRLVKEIEKKIGTPIRAVGIVQAPILNAFAYGPWFDQRFTFIVKDINNFTDQELLGITAHEVSHLKGKHTFWLLWIGFVDLFLRFLFGIPASTLDFAAGVAKGWSFFNYYVVNILFFAIALIFVRIMESNADKRTKEIGYGQELAEALYTLEGFYRGIAGELGLNAQLLTDSTRTDAEEKRFTGEAAIEMHNKLLNPSRYGLTMNLIVSHPPTPFRIAAMVDDELSSLRLALLPILLILPITRKHNLKLLKRHENDFSDLLTTAYKKRFGSVEEYANVTYTKENLNYYINRNVLLISRLDSKQHYIGNVREIKVTNNIVDPFCYVLETEDGEQEVATKSYSIQIFEPKSLYVIKKKQIMTLLDIEVTKKGKYNFIYDNNGKNKKLGYLGISLKDFSSKNSFIIQKRGIYQPLVLHSINGENRVDDIAQTISLGKVPFNFSTFNPGDEMILKGRDMKINLSPVVLFLYKRFEKENLSLIKYLIETKTKVVLYTSKDPDIGIPCEFTRVTDDKNVYYKSSGENTEESIGIRQVDALVLRQPYKLIQSTNEIGIFSKLIDAIFSRSKKFTSL